MKGADGVQIDKAMITRLGELSRLEIAPEEYAPLSAELEEILTCFDKIAGAEQDGEFAQRPAVQNQCALRKDTVSTPLPCGALLENAPEKQDGMFTVPGVM